MHAALRSAWPELLEGVVVVDLDGVDVEGGFGRD